MSILSITNLSKSFGTTKVFTNINITQEAGEILCVSGESGAGKTTLLRCLANLETPDKGEISICGKKLFFESNGVVTSPKGDDLLSITRNLGLVFQNFNLFSHKTVMENIIMAPIHQQLLSKESAKKEALELLSQMNLIGKNDMYPWQLSGGQKQRVAIARSIILKPSILCFDEPTSALDSKNTEEIKDIIKNIAKENKAILIISHDLEFVNSVADNIFCMES